MRWHRGRGQEEAPPVRPSATDEAVAAREESQADLQKALGGWQAVRDVVAELRAIRAENHFAQRVAETMRRRTDL